MLKKKYPVDNVQNNNTYRPRGLNYRPVGLVSIIIIVIILHIRAVISTYPTSGNGVLMTFKELHLRLQILSSSITSILNNSLQTSLLE